MKEKFLQDICKIVGHDWMSNTFALSHWCTRCELHEVRYKPRTTIFVTEKLDIGTLPVYDKDIQ